MGTLNLDRKTAGDKVVLSTAAQADAATAATLNRLMVWDAESFIRRTLDAETNEGQKTGFVEATGIDISGRAAELSLVTTRMQPDHLAWACKMIMGAPTTSALGTGYKHVFKMTSYPTNPPYFTAAYRKGGSSAASAPAAFERFRGCALSSMELQMRKGEFTTLRLAGVGIGYVDDGIVTATFTPTFAGGAATLDLTTAGDPAGANDTERATKIFGVVDADDDGLFETTLVIGTYNSTTNVLNVTSGALTGAHAVRVTFDRDAAVDLWKQDVLDATGQTEYKAKNTNSRLYLGAGIDTSDAEPVIAGGQVAECELDEATWSFNWNAEAVSCWAVNDIPDEQGFAQQIETGAVQQRLAVSRGIRDWLLKQHRDLDKGFAAAMWSVGPEWETNNRYLYRVMFPFCKVFEHTEEANEDKWRDVDNIAVLKDPGAASGGAQANQETVAVVVQNKSASYA